MRELSLHILDALENSLEAGATAIELTIEEDMRADRLTITVRDNGRGMSEAQLDCVFDPFFTTRTTRHVGLGVPLFKAAAQRCNGDLTVTSQPGEGTTLLATFQHSHIDRAPLGDIQGTLLAVILAAASDVPPHPVIPSEARNLTPSEARNLTRNIHYLHRVDGQEFEFSTADMRAELGEIPLTLPPVRKWLQKFIAEGEEKLSLLPAPVSGASLGEEKLSPLSAPVSGASLGEENHSPLSAPVSGASLGEEKLSPLSAPVSGASLGEENHSPLSAPVSGASLGEEKLSPLSAPVSGAFLGEENLRRKSQ